MFIRTLPNVDHVGTSLRGSRWTRLPSKTDILEGKSLKEKLLCCLLLVSKL